MKLISKNMCTSIIFLNHRLSQHPLFSRQHENNTTRNIFLKRINNSSNLNEGNHGWGDDWMPDFNYQRFVRFHFSGVSLVLVASEKIYQTLKKAFDHISKYVEVGQKYSAARRTFNSRCLEIIVIKHGLSSLIFFKSVWFIFSNLSPKSKPAENKLLKIYKMSNHQRKN